MGSFLYSIIIGAVAGWIAGKLMKGGGFGILANIVLGVVGGLVGNWLFNTLGVSLMPGPSGDLLTGVIGAAALLFIAGLLKK
jgi:uncharacterized membrane protein YeaQ/YmgE (transglycosylase-associated protein family)